MHSDTHHTYPDILQAANPRHGYGHIRTSINHIQIFLFSWTGVAFTPVDLNCLSSP